VSSHEWQESLERNALILVAVSGGADSVFLLILLQDMAKEYGWRIAVGHVNHGMRGEESDGDAAFVTDLADRMGVACHSAEIAAPSGGEAGLRRARLGLLKAMARAIGASAIGFGHHRDDVAETFLLNALRGSGPAGLEGMRAVREMEPGLLAIRPLLGFRRAEIEEQLGAWGVVWREDSTNATPIYRRNRVRMEAIAVLESIDPAAVNNIAWSAEFCGDVMDVYTRVVEDAAGKALLAEDGEGILFCVEALRGDGSEGLAAGVLRHFHHRLASRMAVGREDPLSVPRELLLQALRRVREASGDDATFSIGEYVELHLTNHHGVMYFGDSVEEHLLRLARGLAGFYLTETDPIDIRWEDVHRGAPPLKVGDFLVDMHLDTARGEGARDTGEVAAWFDPTAIRGALTIRRVRPNDSIELVGGGRKPARDALAEARVPAAIRSCAAVVADMHRVLWIPGIRRAAGARIGPSTENVLVLGFRRGT